MQVSTSRSVVIISGLLTLLVLSGGTLALAFHNGWLRTGSGGLAADAPSADSQASDIRYDSIAPAAAKSSAVNPTEAAAQDEAAIYRQKLDEAYQALDDDGYRERRSRRHDSDDH